MQNNDVASELRYFCCPKGNIHSGSLHGAESPETVLQRLMVNICFAHIKKAVCYTVHTEEQSRINKSMHGEGKHVCCASTTGRGRNVDVLGHRNRKVKGWAYR